MSTAPTRGGAAVAGWVLFAVLCVTLDITGVVDGLALPMPLLVALVLARALQDRLAALAPALTRATLSLAVVCAVAAVAVLRWRISLFDFSAMMIAVALAGTAVLAALTVERRTRALLMRPLGLDPDSAVHVVSGIAFVMALLVTAVSFVDLQGETPEPVPLGLTDTLVSLLGDGALALAGVGFLQTRGLRAVVERLDLRRLRPRAWLIVAVLAGAFHAGVWALERVENAWLPGVAALENRFDYEFVGLPPVLGGILLSLGVGIGEELLFRGAMQPRFGIIPSALLFAAFHVQYQLPGIGMIFLVGVGMGVVKERTSTTFTAAVHVLYDIGAFLLPDF